MVRVTVSETYDLSTKVDKMSMIGIHTPSFSIIRKTYPGLLVNSKMIRFTSCDVKLACASLLPADPQQIGVESGQIAPQDMFNPILYKAVSNEAMNNFELRMHGMFNQDPNGEIYRGQSVEKTDDLFTGADDFSLYYSLLANRKGWKVAHPQAGLVMRGLRPYVYEKLYNVGDAYSFSAGVPGGDPPDPFEVLTLTETKDEVVEDDRATDYGRATGILTAMRGRPRPMPPISTLVLASSGTEDVGMNGSSGSGSTSYQIPDNGGRNMHIYCGLIITPPAKLTKMYYRLVVRWHIDFLGIRPINDILIPASMRSNADTFYGSDYLPISKNEDNLKGMVDLSDGEINKIMEGI